MANSTDKKKKSTSNGLHLDKNEEGNFEKRKREAYSAMGRLGGLARAKQMAEKGFSLETELKTHSKKANKNKEKDRDVDQARKK